MLLPLYKVITLLHAFSTLLSLLIFSRLFKRPRGAEKAQKPRSPDKTGNWPRVQKNAQKGAGAQKRARSPEKAARRPEKNPEKAQNPRKSRASTKRPKTQKRHRKGSEDAQRAEGQKTQFKLIGPTFNLQKPASAGSSLPSLAAGNFNKYRNQLSC